MSTAPHDAAPWRPLILGHRGAAGLAPENTLVGFRCAADLGLPGAELDLHLTADGALVVIHDHRVEGTTDGRGRVEEMRLDQVRRLDAAVAWHPRFEGTRIPTLDEVLKAFAGRFAWEFELKCDAGTDVPGLVAATAPRIEAYNLAQRVVVTSFEARALEVCARLAPGLRRGLISGGGPLESLRRARDLGCVQVGLNQQVLDAEVGRTVRDAGLALVGWQGDTPAELERLAAARVDAFSSNRPDVALAWLSEHGHEPVVISSHDA